MSEHIESVSEHIESVSGHIATVSGHIAGVSGSDRPILIFYNRYRYRYLYVYVTDNRYSEPIFIYCYKVNK